MIDTELEVEEVVLDKLLDQKDLIVFNDDINTFDHVISSLIKVCKLSLIHI